MTQDGLTDIDMIDPALIESGRLKRAKAIAKKWETVMQCMELGAWMVLGRTTYHVGQNDDGTWKCSCPDFYHHDLGFKPHYCKHLIAVFIINGWHKAGKIEILPEIAA